MPLPRVHPVRYGGCLAPHNRLRGTIIPTPRQQGVEGQETNTEAQRSAYDQVLPPFKSLPVYDLTFFPSWRRS